MSGDRYNGLSDSEREAFRSIADGPVPERELEDRTVTALRQHKLIRSRRGGILMKLSIAVGTVAAVAVIFMVGVKRPDSMVKASGSRVNLRIFS